MAWCRDGELSASACTEGLSRLSAALLRFITVTGFFASWVDWRESRPTCTTLWCKSGECRRRRSKVWRCWGGRGKVGFLFTGWIDQACILLSTFLPSSLRTAIRFSCVLRGIPRRRHLIPSIFPAQNRPKRVFLVRILGVSCLMRFCSTQKIHCRSSTQFWAAYKKKQKTLQWKKWVLRKMFCSLF